MTDKPLYQQLLERPYPAHQHLDETSIDWMIGWASPKACSVHSVVQDYIPMPLDKLSIKEYWFADPQSASGIHGIRHMMRVALYLWILLQAYGSIDSLSESEITGLLQAALLHDLRRLDDNADPDHGRRSARFIEQQFKGLTAPAILAVNYHNDDELPSVLPPRSLQTLRVMKTADALERFRLPKQKWWPDPARMPLAVDPKLFELCKYVTLTTEKISCRQYAFAEIMETLTSWLKQQQLL